MWKQIIPIHRYGAFKVFNISVSDPVFFSPDPDTVIEKNRIWIPDLGSGSRIQSTICKKLRDFRQTRPCLFSVNAWVLQIYWVHDVSNSYRIRIPTIKIPGSGSETLIKIMREWKSVKGAEYPEHYIRVAPDIRPNIKKKN